MSPLETQIMLAKPDPDPDPDPDPYPSLYPPSPCSPQTFLTSNHQSSSTQPPARSASQTSPATVRAIILLAVLLIQAIGVIGSYVSIYISIDPFITKIRSQDRSIVDVFVDYQIFVGYLVIFVIANAFSVYLGLDSLLNKNTPQLIGLCIFEAAMGVFGLILSHQLAIWTDRIVLDDPHLVTHSIKWKLIAVPGIIGFTTLILCWLTWFFYLEFGWLIYRQLGAQIELKIAMRIKSTFFLLQKFIIFLDVGFCVLMFQMRKQSIESEKGGNVNMDMLLPALYMATGCFVIIISILAVELELKFLMGIYLILWVGQMSWSCYELLRLYPIAEKTNTQHNMIFLLTISFVLLSASVALSISCYRNFGKGLKKARDQPNRSRNSRIPTTGPREHIIPFLRSNTILD